MQRGWKAFLSRVVGRLRKSSPQSPPHIALGRKGERVAERFLKNKGWRLHSRNVRMSGGEIDLIFEDPDRTIIFVEVKTRASDSYHAEWSINARKRRRLIHLAQRLAKRNRWTNRKLRIDLVVIVWPERGKPVIRHHESAVTLSR
jgi:putative endonuclease